VTSEWHLSRHRRVRQQFIAAVRAVLEDGRPGGPWSVECGYAGTAAWRPRTVDGLISAGREAAPPKRQVGARPPQKGARGSLHGVRNFLDDHGIAQDFVALVREGDH
jgi:hypothetical protein